MVVVKRSSKNQIAIPKDLLRQAGLAETDVWFDMEYREGRFLLKPLELEERIPPEAISKFEKEVSKVQAGDVVLRSEKAFQKFQTRRKRLLK